MPDLVNNDCKDTEIEIVKSAADLVDGTHTNEINTKGAEKLYFIREVQQVDPTTTVVESAQSGDAITNPANMVDIDESTSGAAFQSSGGTPTVHRFDWGSIASRRVAGLISTNHNSNDVKIEERHSDDAAAWSSYVEVFNTNTDGSPYPKQVKVFIDSTSFRYVELRITGLTIGGVTTSLYEVFDAEEGWGNSGLSLEIKDDARSDWKAISDPATFSVLQSWGITQSQVKELANVMPNKSTGFRTNITQDGKSNYSLVIVKVKPCN